MKCPPSANSQPPTSHRGHSCNLTGHARSRSQEYRAINRVRHQCHQALNQTPSAAAPQRASTATSGMSAPSRQTSDQAGSSNANAGHGHQHAHELPPAAPRAAMFRPEARRANEQEKMREGGDVGAGKESVEELVGDIALQYGLHITLTEAYP